MAKITVKSDDIASIDIVKLRELCKVAIAERGSDVRNELDKIMSIDAATRNRCALIFGLFSPQAAFRPNVDIVKPVIAAIMADNCTPATLREICSHANYRMITKGKVLASGEVREDCKIASSVALSGYVKSGSMPTFTELLKVRGVASKVASMISALGNEYANVITLDTWMLGGVFTGEVCYAKMQKNNYTISSPVVYEKLANIFLEIAKELHVSPFMLQWSFWCYVRGNRHESHLAIFGL